jgi:predicted DNA-binding transcriptional regulator AlpA
MQARLIEKADLLPSSFSFDLLAPEAQRAIAGKLSLLPTNNAITNKPVSSDSLAGVVWNEPVSRDYALVQEALQPPAGLGKSAWISAVAIKNGLSRAQLYRKIQKFNSGGIARFRRTRSTRDQARRWDAEALKRWIGLVLKKEHRKIGRKGLYLILQSEAAKQGWKVGSYQSALWWLARTITPQLTAIQTGGPRALDNSLPPILRNYNDLKPL